MKNVIAIDLGGTKIEAALYEVSSAKSTQINEIKHVPTESQEGFEHVLEQILTLIKTLRTPETQAVGIGIPGYFDTQTGLLYKTPNIPASHNEGPPLNLYEWFKQRLDLPVLADNDANLFTLAAFKEAEAKKGSPIHHPFIGLTLGTGLGSGIIIEGKMLRGAQGIAAEMGHVHYDETREWEDLVSGKSLFKTRGHYLGKIISSLIYIFNPEYIALGGGISKNEFPDMKEAMWEEIHKHHSSLSTQNLNIFVSSTQNGGLEGASQLAKLTKTHA
jgi:glucokinase